MIPTPIQKDNSLLRILLLLLLTSGLACFPQARSNTDTETLLRAIADGILRDASFSFIDGVTGQRVSSPELAPPGASLVPESPYNDWRYWNGVLNLAMLRLGDELQQPEYTQFVRKSIAFAFDHSGYFQQKYKKQGKWNYPFGQFFTMEELDDCGAMGASVIELQQRNPQKRYREYIERAAAHILTKQDRLHDSTLVRSFPAKWTLWADDLYMGLSFLSRMGLLSGEPDYFNDAARQVVNFNKYLVNPANGLMHHCWYSDVQRRGVAFWGRANGWAILAQIDLLDRLPVQHPHRSTVLALFRQHILSIARYQSEEGLWHQLLDKPDSFLETSCSAMFTYAIARGVLKGHLEPRYASIAFRGWEGIATRIHADGKIEGVSAGTGVSEDLVHYYKRPTPLNDIHGIGAVLLAGTEMIQLEKIIK